IARQLVEACGWEQAPRYIVRDRDRVYGKIFVRRVRAMGIRDPPVSPRSPWQNGYAERLIGSIRKACFDHVLGLCGRQPRALLLAETKSYNEPRTHVSLNKDGPRSQGVEGVGRILCLAILVGLHHHCSRI